MATLKKEIAAIATQELETAESVAMLPKAAAHLATRFAASLSMPNKTAQDELLAMELMLSTPYIGGAAAADQETIVTIVGCAEGQVEDTENKGQFFDQYLYLCRLQTPIAYTTKTKVEKDFKAGDTVLLGLRKSGRIRDMFYAIVSKHTQGGEVMPNLLIVAVPAKNPMHHDAIAFRQVAV